jgi:hypothetical protein
VAGRREERFDTTMPVQLEQGFGVARNVSATGIYFVTDVALEKGMAVSLTLDFKDYPGGLLRVKCTANVVRVEQRDGRIGVGAAITAFEFNRVGDSKDEPD